MKQENNEINIESEENDMFCGDTYVYSFKIFFELLYKRILQYAHKNFMP
jgi:hypothetical protein